MVSANGIYYLRVKAIYPYDILHVMYYALYLTAGVSSRTQPEYLTVSLVRLRSVKSSFRQHCYGKSASIFHESADNREGMPEHPTLPSIVIFPFLSRDSVHLFAADRSFAVVSHGHPRPKCYRYRILINGKSTGHYIQRHKSKRRVIDDLRIKPSIIPGYLIRDVCQ